MAQKLEVLKPRNGASSVAPPRVLSDASMSLSFKLPANYLRSAPRAPVSLQSHPTEELRPQQTTKSHHQPAVRDAWSDDDDEAGDNALSWEDRDFSVQVEGVTPPRANGDEEQDELVSNAMAAMEIGGWEEQDAPELPDDFPLLLVNLTRMQKEHFPQERGAAGANALSEGEMRQVFELVKDTLHRHFTQMVEVLFEQSESCALSCLSALSIILMLTILLGVVALESCFHCTYGTSRGMLRNLHAAYPEDVFGLIDYPTEVQGIELSEFLHVLSRPSRWRSVDYLKDCLRRCSRDLKWKLDVAVELEVLADKEYEVFTTEQERLGLEIDELTRLRDSFKVKLDKLMGKETSESSKKAGNQQYLLLRKLEDIETRLVSLLDTYLQEPELEESECDGMFDGATAGHDGLARGMNVLDMVVAMIFSRLPRDFSQQMTSEEHFQMLFDHHIHIRRLWKKDFGRLPPRTNAVALYAADSDADSVDEEMKNGRNDDDQHEHQHASFQHDDSDDDGDEEFESYESVDMSPAGAANRGFRNATSSSSESWESVYADEPRENGVGSGGEDEDEGAKSDGYGADYDSDESEDGHSAAASLAAPAPGTSSTTLPRRARARRPAPLVFSDEEKETASKKKKKEKKAKSSKKERKTKKKKEEDAPFQPFACTGALNFLRIAKENEMF